jgi:Tol biopolymer transport system component
VETEDQSRVWVLDVASGLARPISPERVWDYSARWAPDGRIAFSRWQGSESQELLAMEATPGATPEPLLPMTGEGKVTQDEATFSPDGRYVVCSHWPRDGREPGVYLFEMGDGDHARALFASQGMEGVAAFSPDGKWVAYNANATGRYEVYLRQFIPEHQESAPIYPVTKDGGMNPMWSADGKTLYYRSAGDERATMFAVTVGTEPEPSISDRRTVLTGLKGSPYIVPMPDGRFIREMPAKGAADRRPDLRLILNWGLGAGKP